MGVHGESEEVCKFVFAIVGVFPYGTWYSPGDKFDILPDEKDCMPFTLLLLILLLSFIADDREVLPVVDIIFRPEGFVNECAEADDDGNAKWSIILAAESDGSSSSRLRLVFLVPYIDELVEDATEFDTVALLPTEDVRVNAAGEDEETADLVNRESAAGLRLIPSLRLTGSRWPLF